MKKRVLFYCQSLLGIGHLVRSRELLFALRDFEVCFLYGGEAVPGYDWPAWVEVIYLPALRSDAAFEKLFVVDDQVTLAEVKAQRKELLQATFDRFAPDILLIELFPFGRKKFKFELLPLLAHAHATRPATKIVCSLRDILVHRPDQARYEADVCALMNQYFDLLLIHADPRLQRLEETFGSLAQLTCPVRYTGYVAQPASGKAPAPAATEPLIVVSIGGGRVGHELIASALAAAPQLPPTLRWQMFTGPHMPDEQFDRLQQQAAGLANVTLQRHTTEFPAWLRQAALSLSMAGYNTCMDILSAQARALVYPFNEHDNQEQTLRARKLAALGYVNVLEPALLAPDYLAAEIKRALAMPPPASNTALDLTGAPKTAEWLTALLAAELATESS